MAGEPGTETGGEQRPSWLRRPGPLRSPQAIGGVCLLSAVVLAAGVTASMRLTSATVNTVVAQQAAAAEFMIREGIRSE